MTPPNKKDLPQKNADTTADPKKTTEIIIGAAIEVHCALGPGLLESTCEASLAYELTERGLKVERQKNFAGEISGVHVDCGYRIEWWKTLSWLS